MSSSFFYIYKELRNELNYFLIDKLTRFTKVKKYLSLDLIKLNLGSGNNLRKGFINIDMNKCADLRLDLRKPLPFKKNSVDYIYSEHFFEHLNYYDTTAIQCLRDYLRILKKRGKIRLVVPDMEQILNAYVNKDMKYFELVNIAAIIPQSKKYISIIDHINYAVYQLGEHKYCYDFEKMHLILKSVGFINIKKEQFDPKEDSNAELRKRYSLYIEAEK